MPLQKKKKCAENVCRRCKNPGTKCAVLKPAFPSASPQFRQLWRTFRPLYWGRSAQFRALLWYVITLALVCRVPRTASNYINETRSDGRPRVPLAIDAQECYCMVVQQVERLSVRSARGKTASSLAITAEVSVFSNLSNKLWISSYNLPRRHTGEAEV